MEVNIFLLYAWKVGGGTFGILEHVTSEWPDDAFSYSTIGYIRTPEPGNQKAETRGDFG